MSDILGTPDEATYTTQQFATALLGPFFAAWIFHFIVSGIAFTQFSNYLTTDLYKRDPRGTKILLWLVMLVHLASVGIAAEMFYHYGISQDRSLNAVYVFRAIDNSPFLLSAISAALMESFLVKRAAGLFDSNMGWNALYFGAFNFLIVTALLGQVGSYTVSLLYTYDKYVPAWATPNVFAGIWLWTTCFVDVSMSVALYILLKRRFEGDLRSVKGVVETAFKTASITSLFTIMGATMAIAWPQSHTITANANVVFSLPLTGLYALSLLITLSSRTERTVVVVGETLAGYNKTEVFSERIRRSIAAGSGAGGMGAITAIEEGKMEALSESPRTDSTDELELEVVVSEKDLARLDSLEDGIPARHVTVGGAAFGGLLSLSEQASGGAHQTTIVNSSASEGQKRRASVQALHDLGF